MSEERVQLNTEAEEAALARQEAALARQEAALARRRQDNGEAANGARSPTDQEESDVLLDVPNLEVEKIALEVDNLRARLSVLAELANLLNLSVGADVQLGQVKLEIEGVRAQALLKVRLENIRAILEKALETLGQRPEILENLAQTANEELRQTLGNASSALDDVLGELDVGDTVDEALKGRLEGTRANLEEVLERQGGEGRSVEQTLDESGGEVSAEVVVRQAEGTQNEMQATPAAKRQAEESGVDLSRVKGTGADGRITIRDVRNAAQEE